MKLSFINLATQSCEDCRFFCDYEDGDHFCSLFNKDFWEDDKRLEECNENLTVSIE
jgi:deoxyribodipyrimidine photolyase-like uncharacterized protein